MRSTALLLATLLALAHCHRDDPTPPSTRRDPPAAQGQAKVPPAPPPTVAPAPTPPSVPEPAPSPAAPPQFFEPITCRTDADCPRLACGPCSAGTAVRAWARVVRCTRNPCPGSTAICQRGACVVR